MPIAASGTWSLAPSRAAERDAVEIIARLDAGRPGHGAIFLAELSRTLGFIRENPEMYAPFSKRYRRAVIHRFPYSVVYRFNPPTRLSDPTPAIVIVGILPDKWHPRRFTERTRPAN